MSGLGPILPGRMPGSLVAQRLSQTMTANRRSLAHLQDQLGSGQRFFISSEDPAAANRTMLLQTLRERKTQFLRNVETDRSLLSSTESSLGVVTDALYRARQLILAGVGSTSTGDERQGLADEAASLIRKAVDAGNTSFRGRFVFAGSRANETPFILHAADGVRYDGDRQSIETLIDLSAILANNVDGHTALGGFSSTVSRDVNPGLTLQTKLRDLHGGGGVTPGAIVVSLSAGSQSATVDLSGSDTIEDLKTRIENAFTPGSLTVSINASQNGLLLTPSSGTVTVSDPAGGSVAANLGIVGGPAATITGTDLNAALSGATTLSSLNGGTGIGVTAGNGLRIVNGSTVSTIDLTGAVTVEDLLNRIRQADPGLSAEINAAGNGLEIASRLSGVDFSIGENNGNNATLLGIRTLYAGTALADLNHGEGVPVAGGTLEITRRNGSTVSIDLSAALTVQDVLNTINAVSPGNLVASLVTVGNGLRLTDNSGTGPLSVTANDVGQALGLAGTEPGSNPLIPLNGSDVNPQEISGSLNILVRVERALLAGDDNELERLGGLIESEIARVNLVRGEVGVRLKALDDAGRRLEDEDVEIARSLSENFDTDLADVLSQIVNQQTLYQALLQTAARTLQMGLIDYL